MTGLEKLPGRLPGSWRIGIGEGSANRNHWVKLMTTGEKIREARINARLTEKQLGELCGISESTISRYERGERNPKVKTLKKIAAHLSLNWTSLYCDSNDKEEGREKTCDIIRHFRKMAGLTQEELGRHLDVSGQMVFLYENGCIDIKISTLKKIADALGVNYKSLLPD